MTERERDWAAERAEEIIPSRIALRRPDVAEALRQARRDADSEWLEMLNAETVGVLEPHGTGYGIEVGRVTVRTLVGDMREIEAEARRDGAIAVLEKRVIRNCPCWPCRNARSEIARLKAGGEV